MSDRLKSRTEVRQRQRLLIGAAVFLALAGFGAFTLWHFAWPAEELAAAAEALRQWNLQEARSRLDHYLSRWPGDKKALLLATRAAWQAGAFADAERLMSEYERLAATTDASRLEWTLIGACQGDFANDESWLKSAAERNNADTSPILEALAEGYQLAYRWQDAYHTLNQLIAREPTYAAPLVRRGTIRRRLGGLFEAEKVEKDFRQAVALAPENTAAHGALAGALMDLGLIREAMRHYDLVLSVQPANAAALLGLARAYTDAAQLAEAERRLDAILAAHPDHTDGLVERGRLALRRGQAATAEGFLARAIRVAPWHRAGHRLYLAALKELGRGEAARQCETRLAELKAEDVAGGRLRMRIELAPTDVAAHWEFYQWCLRNGEYRDGFGRLLEILRLDPGHGMAHTALAEHFERAGQPRRAAQHRELARNVNTPG